MSDFPLTLSGDLQDATTAISEGPEIESLMDGLPDMNWVWDIGFPSVMPIDVDSYQLLDADRT
jgi:hypothetical protein